MNPIEYIWKSIKRVISRSFVRDIDHMRALIRDSFLENAKKLSFAGYWIERFLGDGILARGGQDAQCALWERQENECRGVQAEGQGEEGRGAGLP